VTNPATRPLRVLVVGDGDLTSLRSLLGQTELGESALECVGTHEVGNTLRDRPPDCLLVVHRPPSWDAVAMLSDLSSVRNSTPIFALVDAADHPAAAEITNAGADDFIDWRTLSVERLQRSLRYTAALRRVEEVEEERRRLVGREREAMRQAQAAHRVRDELLATLSHELRTPLNAILGWSRLLVSGNLDPSTSRRALEIIERNTKLQAQLIDDLLDMSRIVAGNLRLEFRAVLARTVLDAAVASVRPAATAKQIELEYRTDEAGGAILCDPARMQQIIWNLLSNAIKFTPPRGSVTVTAGLSADALVIAITDTGIGIAPACLPYVFDRFWQQDAATTRTHGGVGLGLSIVRHLVEMHGGTVEAKSEGEGRGASFVVTIPLAPAKAVDEERMKAAGVGVREELPSLARIRVIVADDESDARALMAAVLESRGAKVVLVHSPADAIAEIRQRCPDVLLSGFTGEDNDALIRTVRALDPPGSGLAAAAMSESPTAADRTRTLLAGYQAHISKPIDPSELIARVVALARQRLGLSQTRS
jgi:signal transduction histidine kinase/CheY-like chemotaxis protein